MMEHYKDIEWNKKSIDEVYEYINFITDEIDLYKFLLFLLNKYPDIKLDYVEIFVEMMDSEIDDTNYIIVKELVDILSDQYLDEYLQSYGYIEYGLCNYSIFKNDWNGLNERIELIKRNPVSGCDVVTMRLLYQLIFDGKYEKALEFSRAIWKPLEDAVDLFGYPAYIFIKTIINEGLQKLYESKLLGISLDAEPIYKEASIMGFENCERNFSNIIQGILGELDKKVIQSMIERRSSDVVILLSNHFAKYMYTKYKMPFIFSDCLWHFIRTSNIFGKANETENWFYVSPVILEDYIDSHFSFISSNRSLEVFGCIWGMEYIYDFFHSNQLISDFYYQEMLENIEYFRMEMIKIFYSDLWQFKFVLEWPKMNQRKQYNREVELFNSTYGMSNKDARALVDDYLLEYIKPERLEMYSKIKSVESNMRFDEDIFQTPFVKSEADIGRNDPCPCGSGKKYKKCCMK